MAKKRAESKPLSSSNGKKKKKSAKHLLSAPNAAARKSLKPARENPFETIWSRRKLDVVGKRRKGEGLRIGLARSRATDKRNKTLLKEYVQSRKSSTFLDKRIGENNDDLEEFDKAILRLQRERQLKLKRESKYNMSDGEEDDYTMYQDRSLSVMDDFEDEMPPDDDEDENLPTLKHINPQSMHNVSEDSLLEGEENKHKTKKQIMEELIFKSKLGKAHKAREKEADEHLLEQLDKDFTSLAQSEALLSLTQPSKMNALKGLLNNSNTKHIDKEGLSSSAGEYNKEKPDSFDRLVKEMVLERRARPSDRTKTPEEIAQEERERLELLEEERLKRMLAPNDSDEEGSDIGEGFPESSAKKNKLVSGDDLGDSFSDDKEQANKTGWVDDILEGKIVDNHEDDTSSEVSESEGEDGVNDDADDNDKEKSSDDGGADDSENICSVKDWKHSDDDDLDTDEEEATEDSVLKKIDNDASNMTIEKTELKNASNKNTSGKLPLVKKEPLSFVIEAPNNLTELCLLLDDRLDPEVVEAINRIRAYNNIRLSVVNRKKMQVFYGVLLQYFAVLAARKPLNFNLINLLVKPLIEMSADTPYFAAICARERLMRMRTQFCEDVKNPEKNSWPSVKSLLLLRLWSVIFPCSDFRHVVMTPATLLMCEYLMRCPITNGRDIAIGSLLCSMVLSVAKQSQKFSPEAVVFLQVLLMSATKLEPGMQQLSQCYYYMDLRTLKPWLQIRNQVCDVHPIDFLMVMDMPVESSFFDSDNFRASILLSVIDTVRGFISIYEGLSSFPELFLPISALLHEVIKQASVPDTLRSNMEDVAQLIKKKAVECQILRKPLQLRKEKPVPIKLLNPKFEEDFVKGRDYDPDRERVERKKLKKLLKREAKGAARELRKDNYFLSEVKEKERLLLEEERAEKFGKARAFLQDQEHAFKSGQLGKGRKRRR